MLIMPWLESHIGTFEDGLNRINQFHWFLSIVEKGEGQWIVKGGDQVIFATDSRETLDAFLYGMSLAYAGIPDDLFERLVKDTEDWVK